MGRYCRKTDRADAYQKGLVRRRSRSLPTLPHPILREHLLLEDNTDDYAGGIAQRSTGLRFTKGPGTKRIAFVTCLATHQVSSWLRHHYRTRPTISRTRTTASVFNCSWRTALCLVRLGVPPIFFRCGVLSAVLSHIYY